MALNDFTMPTNLGVLSRHPKAIIGIVVALIVIIFSYGALNGVYNAGVQQEQRLKAQYLDNQNELSAYIAGFYEQVGVAKSAGTALNQILLDAVKGRYESTSAGGGGYTVDSPFFNAIVEAYPESSPTELVAIWGRIQTYVVAGRERYRNTQSKLLDMLRGYDTWRISGIVQSNFVRILGFPSDNLEATVGDNTVRGQDALDKMYQLVLTKDAQNAYENGTLDPLEIPND